MVSEMPEGALESDEEEKKVDPNDPHAALNIDLSAPFVESDYIKGPVPYSQRTNPPPALNLTERRTKGKKKRKKRGVEEEDEPTKSVELEKKKTLKDIVAEAEKKTQIAVHKVPEPEPEFTSQSISDWLNERKPGEGPPLKSDKPKKKKGKPKETTKPAKTKKKKKKNSEGDKENTSNNLVPDIMSLEENGVSSTSSPAGVILGEDESLSVRYHPHVPSHSNLSLSLDFTNSSPQLVSNIKFDVSDSINTKLVRSSPGGLLLPFCLSAGQTNSFTISLSLQSIYISQKLRGSVTYFIDNPDGGKDEKIINFSLPLNLALFIVSAPCSESQFTELIASNSLGAAGSISLPLSSSNDECVEHFSTRFKLTLVERVEGAASLYGKTARDDELCVLMKLNGSISIEIKGSDQQLVNSFVDLVNSAKL